jgi:hypothetical protein
MPAKAPTDVDTPGTTVVRSTSETFTPGLTKIAMIFSFQEIYGILFGVFIIL